MWAHHWLLKVLETKVMWPSLKGVKTEWMQVWENSIHFAIYAMKSKQTYQTSKTIRMTWWSEARYALQFVPVSCHLLPLCIHPLYITLAKMPLGLSLHWRAIFSVKVSKSKNFTRWKWVGKTFSLKVLDIHTYHTHTVKKKCVKMTARLAGSGNLSTGNQIIFTFIRSFCQLAFFQFFLALLFF